MSVGWVPRAAMLGPYLVGDSDRISHRCLKRKGFRRWLERHGQKKEEGGEKVDRLAHWPVKAMQEPSYAPPPSDSWIAEVTCTRSRRG